MLKDKKRRKFIMKRAISVLLAILMIFTLFACSSKDPAPSAEPSTSPAASPSPSDSQAPSASEPADVSENENEIGFFFSGVDPASRETYEIVFAYPRNMTLMQNLSDRLTDFSKKLNYTLQTTTGDGDIDLYLQNIEILAGKGVDGFITNPDPATSDRIVEVLEETGVPYMILLNSVRDSSGSSILPCATLDGFAAGESEIQWLYDNYKTYWGDIDPAEIGLININWSPNVDLASRYEGSLSKFQELLPNNADKIFSCDGVTGKMDPETGYNMTTPIFSANSSIKYWFVTSALEMYSQGAARAAEALGIEKNVLVTCVGSDILRAEWEAGYDGCWVSCVAVSDYLYIAPTISALVALIDGKATHESLWASRRAPGDKGTIYYIGNEIVTKDTYKDYYASIQAAFDSI
jgi:ABC-type sugar transport system substrate-binding protein